MRPKADINFELVDAMLEAGCTGTEVAARLGMHEDTLTNRIKEEKKMGFSAYRQQKVAKGDQLLRETLFAKAKNGDTTSLIFLGKTRLGMSEKMEVQHSASDALTQTVINIAFRPPSDVAPSDSSKSKRTKVPRG